MTLTAPQRRVLEVLASGGWIEDDRDGSRLYDAQHVQVAVGEVAKTRIFLHRQGLTEAFREGKGHPWIYRINGKGRATLKEVEAVR